MTAQPLSAAEAATVARFDAAEPAPESWRGGGLREAIAVIHAWDDDDDGTYADLAARFTAWAEQRARERAAAIVARVKALPVYEVKDDDDLLGHVILAQDAIDALAADDRTGHR